ncbi:MAG: hypothetical protein LBF88_02020 [Planctomycetaceae bacterium]|jgi:hypothetical protein|nr:hypothetical protein [Planctomycetaceae bacterium]
MKKILFYICTTVIVVILQQEHNVIPAAEVINGLYRLTIQADEPAYKPKVPRRSVRAEAWDNKTNKPSKKTLPNDITATFKIRLELNVPKRGYEDVRHKARNSVFTITLEGEEFYVKKFVGGAIYQYPNKKEDGSIDYSIMTRSQATALPAKVQPVLIAFETGTKRVTLRIKTEIDNVILETEETIEIFVPDYIFTVFERKGKEHDMERKHIPLRSIVVLKMKYST